MIVIRLDRQTGIHSYGNLDSKSLTSLCRKIRDAGIPDDSAVTNDGRGDCMRLRSVYAYAELVLVETDHGFQYQKWRPFPGIAKKDADEDMDEAA